jgi:hypothetical protein
MCAARVRVASGAVRAITARAGPDVHDTIAEVLPDVKQVRRVGVLLDELALLPISRNAGRLVSCFLIPRSSGLLIVVSVRKARPSLWNCLGDGVVAAGSARFRCGPGRRIRRGAARARPPVRHLRIPGRKPSTLASGSDRFATLR